MTIVEVLALRSVAEQYRSLRNFLSVTIDIARLAAFVPRPRAILTRYHGVFAPPCRSDNTSFQPRTPHHGRIQGPPSIFTGSNRRGL